ncbi:MAG: glycosyltransferase, partial [bacterium]|nr:glycosyltransferase [bacterium]
DVSPILSVYRNTDYVEKYIYSLLRKGNYDYMFFYPDAINPDFSDNFFEAVRSKGIPIINFLVDDEPDVWFKQNLPYDHRFDLVATHSRKGYQLRLEMGKADHFIYLPWGFSEDLFDRVQGVDSLYDVVYIGSNLCREHDPNCYFGVGYLRQKLLTDVYEFCKEKNLVFNVFGPGWHRHPVLEACNGGLLSNHEMVEVYNQAKIVLNPGFSADENEISSYQTKLRHFEVVGCGAFQLVNRNPELEALFNANEDIVYFHDTYTLKEKISYYIQHDQERKRIADNVYQKRHLHTTSSRLKELFNRAMAICP